MGNGKRQILIEIPEEEYKRMVEKRMFGRVDVWKDAICNGTPLPKGHGRLIDEDAIKKYIEDGAICLKCVGNGWGCQDDCTFPDYVDYKMEKMLKEQETVVEADKEGQDGKQEN